MIAFRMGMFYASKIIGFTKSILIHTLLLYWYYTIFYYLYIKLFFHITTDKNTIIEKIIVFISKNFILHICILFNFRRESNKLEKLSIYSLIIA